MKLSKNKEVRLKNLVFHSEFPKEIQRRFERQKEKKRNEKNLKPPEGFVIHSESRKGNSKKVWKPKKKRKEMRRI